MASINVNTTNSGSVTYEGGKAYRRSPKQELFLLAASFLNEPKFYETSNEQKSRIDELAEAVANDGKWILNLVEWLRGDGGLRTSAQVVAAACVHARLKLGIDSKDGLNRKIISASIHRADEGPALLAFYIDRYGKNVPKPVKRGVADALNRMNESQYLKYRGKTNRGAISIADAISITHPTPKDQLHDALFAYALNEQHGGKCDDTDLPLIAARNAFEKLQQKTRKEFLTNPTYTSIEKLQLTHEYVFSAMPDATDNEKLMAWNKLIPTMGYQACLMNTRRILALCGEDVEPSASQTIRNWFMNDCDEMFDERQHDKPKPDVSPVLVNKVEWKLFDRLSNPNEYKVMPLSFLAAYRNVPSVAQGVLSDTVWKTLDNIPVLSGRTLILVDGSGSMMGSMSSRSSVSLFDNACMFATALAYKSNAEVYRFNSEAQRVDLKPYIDASKSMLEAIDAFGSAMGGTRVAYSTQQAYHDCVSRGVEINRVIVITDEQTSFTDKPCFYTWRGNSDIALGDAVPSDIPFYVWNVGGYRPAIDLGTPNRMALGGLTDSAFKLITYVENVGNVDGEQKWPWDDIDAK